MVIGAGGSASSTDSGSPTGWESTPPTDPSYLLKLARPEPDDDWIGDFVDDLENPRLTPWLREERRKQNPPPLLDAAEIKPDLSTILLIDELRLDLATLPHLEDISPHCCPNVERQGRNNNLTDRG
jgi:hypothetical protein